MKDPEGFIILVTLGDVFSGWTLCDLGAIINLMPTSVFYQLDLGEPKPTPIRLQMVDRSIKVPREFIKDVLVRVERLIFPVTFVVLNMEVDEDVLLIICRPFLSMVKIIIDVFEGELTMQIYDEMVVFNNFQEMKFLAYVEITKCYAMKILKSNEYLEASSEEQRGISSVEKLEERFKNLTLNEPRGKTEIEALERRFRDINLKTSRRDID